jgi:Glycosyltransferase family 87
MWTRVPKIFVSLRQLARISDYRFAILSAGIVFAISAIGHWPNFGATSDITTSFWGRTNGNGVPYLTYEIPYVGYIFEYPPVCGLILWLAGWSSGGNLYAYTAIVFVVLGACFVLSAHFLYNFLNYLKLDHNLQWLFTIFVPSVVIFGAYNFDIIQTFFVILALYFFIAQNRPFLSAAALGMAIGTKLFPIVLVPFFLQDLRKKKRVKAAARYAVISLGIPTSMNLPFAILNFSNWISGYTFLEHWGLEDTFLVWLFPSPSSWSTAEIVSGGLVLLSVALIFVYLRDRPLLVRCFLAIGSYILFAYISAPQMNLDLLPFFALVPLVPLPLFYVFDGATGLFIALWDTFPDPRFPGVVQGISLIRQIALACILTIVWKATGVKKPVGRPVPVVINQKLE